MRWDMPERGTRFIEGDLFCKVPEGTHMNDFQAALPIVFTPQDSFKTTLR
jgi:hypothetical protein